MSAHPKIQKMCEEESEDTEAVAKLFEINDSINRTIERYRLVKKGDLEAAAKIPVGTLGTSGAGVGRGNNNELSLIDLGGPDDDALAPQQASAGSSQPPKTGNALEDDLLGLSIGGGESYGQGGALSLGNGFASPPPQQATSSGPHFSNAQITNLFNASAPSPVPSSAPSFAPQAAPSPRADPFASLGSQSTSRLSGSGFTGSKPSSPFPQFQQSISKPHPPQSQPQQTSINDILGFGTTAAAAPQEDEWTFTSALPTTPQSHTLTIHTSPSISISWSITRASPAQINITSSVSNTSATPVSELTFQVAVSKGYSLSMEPQSGRDLAPRQSGGIRQVIRVQVPTGEGGKVKMRWKVAYRVAGEGKEEMGEVSQLGVH